ncbi:MAG: fructose-6-phosphate aldolase [Chloroflexi bacterium RBG_16_64_32]|nr:MAG: fructose-6-phosphate aldolase [Chloroflexi bacterium RBG_16_64_32]
MKIWLDTANVDEIRAAARFGVVSGVTTNPSLWAKAASGIEYREVVVEICSVIEGPVSAECVAQDVDGLVEEARSIASWHPNVVVKIPLDETGLEAIHRVSREGIKVNTTLIFQPNQAMLAAEAGATYVSPFVGRLDDIGHDGMAVVRDIVEIFDRYHFSTHVLAASLRHPLHVIQAAKAGAHIATVPYAVLQAMFKHPLTDVGMQKFLEDARKAATVRS